MHEVAKFRWRKGELEKLDKGIKQFNARLKALEKKGFSSSTLPAKMNYYETRDFIIQNNENPRKYLEEQFKMIKILRDKKNEKTVKSERGLKLPVFTKKILEIKVKAINREREKSKKYYEQFEPTSRGEKIHDSNRDTEDKFRPKKFNWKNMSTKDFEMNLKTYGEYSTLKSDRNKLYRDNFYKAMINKMTDEEFKNLKPILDNIPTDELVKQYYVDRDMSIGFFYEPSDRELLMESIIESWTNLATEKGYIERID